MNQSFERYIGIDYSGAQTPASSLKGLRVYLADRSTVPQEVQPPVSPRKYWTRRGIAEWLVERLSEGPLTVVGIDHGFSFPLQYLRTSRIAATTGRCFLKTSSTTGRPTRTFTLILSVTVAPETVQLAQAILVGGG